MTHSTDDTNHALEVAASQMRRAIALERDGKAEEALKVCEEILALGDLPGQIAARTSALFRSLGQPERADRIRDRLLEHLDAALQTHQDDAQLLREAGILNDFFGYSEKAEDLMRRAVALDKSLSQLGLSLSRLCLKRGDVEAARAHWDPIIEAADDPAGLLLTLTKMFGHFGETAVAETYLARAEPLCTKNRTKFEATAAAIRGGGGRLDQHATVVDVFDGFANSYDEVLEGLKNRGPDLMREMVEILGFEKKRRHRVLDAGCGTGLCAPHLKPYAKELTGADISIGMLEAAREKEVYDFLVRTDLSVPYTYPEGTFDLIVSSDVLVYFGDLSPIFENIFAALNPGGWFIFTVEKADDPVPDLGYDMGSSGRYRHGEAFILDALRRARFSKPKHMVTRTLRMEFAMPVEAYVVATQKPVLFAPG